MGSIDKISPEILDIILSYVPDNDDSKSSVDYCFSYTYSSPPPPRVPSRLPLYSTVSRRWQDHFEARIYKRVCVKSTDLDQFSRIVVGDRLAAISRLEYHVVLPTYGDEACAELETDLEKLSNSEAFTIAIRGLFKILKSWEMDFDDQSKRGRIPTPNPLVLDLSAIYSPMDGIYRVKYKENRLQYRLGQRRDLWDGRYRHSFINFLGVESLPSITRVSELEAQLSSHRTVTSSVLAMIASRLPNLKSIYWSCSDDEKKYPELQRQMRYGRKSEAFSVILKVLG
jgi:hypothetical protein